MWKLLILVFSLLSTALSVRTRNANADAVATKIVLEKLNDANSYNSAIRPSADGGTTTVKTQFYIREIDVDDENMKVDFDLTFRMVWNDTRLKFNTPGVDYVNILDSHLAWLPDAFFKNAITTQLNSIYPENYLRVFPDGRLIYSTRLMVKQNCPMALNRFPHDTQKCNIDVASYGYTSDEVKFIMSDDEVMFVRDIYVEKFKLDNIGDEMQSYCDTKTATGVYSCIRITIALRRVFSTYLLEWYVPTIFLVVVAYFSFLIPGEQFLARLILTLIPLISLASFSLSFRQSLASVSYVRGLDIFTGISLVIIFATLIHVIVCYIRDSKKAAAEQAGSDEEGGKNTGEEPSKWRRFFEKHSERAEFLSRCILVGTYVFFLFVYFAAYCGTG